LFNSAARGLCVNLKNEQFLTFMEFSSKTRR